MPILNEKTLDDFSFGGLRRFASHLAGTWLWLGLIVLPILPDRIAPFDSEMGTNNLIALFELTFISLVCVSHTPRTWVLPSIKPFYKVLTAVWAIWALLSAMAAPHWQMSLIRQAEWFTHILFAVAVCTYIHYHPALAHRALVAIVGSFLFYMAWFCMLWFVLDDPYSYPWGASMPGIIYLRHFGHYASLCFVISLGLFLSRHNGKFYGLNAAVLLVSATMIFWAGGRAPLLILSLLLPLLYLSCPAFRKPSTLWTVLLVTLAGAWLSSWFAPHAFGLNRVASSILAANTTDDLSSGRLTIWQDALFALSAHPWFGIGPNEFAVSIGRKYNILQPHNFLIQSLLSWGIPGAACSWILLSKLVAQGWQQSKYQLAHPEFYFHGLAFYGALLLIFMSLLDGTLYHGLPLLFVSTLAGITAAPIASASNVLTKQGLIRYALPLLFLLIGAHTYALLKVWYDDHPIMQPKTLTVLHFVPTPLLDLQVDQWVAEHAAAVLSQDPTKTCQMLEWAAEYARPPFHIMFDQAVELIAEGHLEDAENVLKNQILMPMAADTKKRNGLPDRCLPVIP